MKVCFLKIPVIGLLLLLFSGGAQVKLPEVRAIWIVRYDYKTPEDVAAIMSNCARAGFTDVFFQVRGNATVFYPSKIEPWAWELAGNSAADTGKNPGFDPLKIAATEARRHRLNLHAYINVLPGWRGFADPPAESGQLWAVHPDWFMVDSTGTRMRATSAWYNFLAPANPAVQRHLARIAAELAAYDLAGLHLDYIRFPYDYKDVAREIYKTATPDEIKAHSDFTYDEATLTAVKKSFGSDISRDHWNSFRRASITHTVDNLRTVFKARRGPQAILSSSVLADLNDGYNDAFQDSKKWARERKVDWIVPMNYNARLFDIRLNRLRNALGKRCTATQLVIGIDCKAEPAEIRRQINTVRSSGARGFALFAYSHLFKNHAPTEKASVLFP
ncbi:MAG: family 10 glycosylhydrolase [Kiritimatiellales bacterium]